jgi:uncharacterized membrane protein YfcA
VTAFGLTTATTYALSGLVDWRLVALFIAGGLVGGLIGAGLAKKLSEQKAILSRVFAVVVAIVGVYIVVRAAASISF